MRDERAPEHTEEGTLGKGAGSRCGEGGGTQLDKDLPPPQRRNQVGRWRLDAPGSRARLSIPRAGRLQDSGCPRVQCVGCALQEGSLRGAREAAIQPAPPPPPRPPRAGRTEHLRPILSKVPKGLAAARTAPVRCRSPGQEPGGRALAPTRPGLSGGEPEIPCLGLRLPHLADAGRRGLPDSHGPIELCALKWSPVSESTSSPCRAHCAGWEGSTRVLVQVRATQNQPSSTARAVSEPCALWCGLRSPQVAVPSQLPFEGLILCQSLVESVGRCPVRTSWV